jgi:hypothetical protein
VSYRYELGRGRQVSTLSRLQTCGDPSSRPRSSLQLYMPLLRCARSSVR